ncbi:hypothetical protein HNQ71_004069 [Mesorhizobium sangaii]|uniref:Uncharacterized protein n=1 Tax=Mesorhizobium sangaii TaxID=505389 RepID=A0A841PSR1_9HYPH|nr:hypothetical protein [Mesorhizobium sangaii]
MLAMAMRSSIHPAKLSTVPDTNRVGFLIAGTASLLHRRESRFASTVLSLPFLGGLK